MDGIDWRKEFFDFSEEHEELLDAYIKSRKRELELLEIIAQYEILEEEEGEI